MASPKALAAIALTIIVAMPLCLGYALASETVEVSEWSSAESVSLSDAILNSEHPIYTTYSESRNNSTVIRPYNGQVYTPDYLVTSTTYTSLPTYETSSGTVDLGAPTRGTKNIGYTSQSTDGTSLFIGSGGLEGDITRVRTDFDGTIHLKYHTANGDTEIPLAYGTQTLVFFHNLDGSYNLTYQNTTYTGSYFVFAVQMIMGDNVNHAMVYATGSLHQIEINSPEWSVNFNSAYVYLKLEKDDTIVPIQTLSAQILTKINDTVLFDNTVYTGVSEVYAAATNYPNTYSYTYVTPSGQYADPSYGWYLPGTYTFHWTNTYHNDYVRMMVNFQNNDTVSIKPLFINNPDGTSISIVYTGGAISINGTNFGQYSTLMLEFTAEKTVITGLQNGWPSMGTYPQGYNVREIANNTSGEMSFIEMKTNNYGRTQFRVDNSRILSGSYPNTLDYTLNMNGLFPGESYSLKLNSIGIYGSSITVGSITYPVTNGRIYVGSETVPLKGTVISSTYNGSVYENYIGGNYIGTSSAPASITFGGEWSLTVTANILEQVNVTKTEWAPGQFVFDDQESFSGALIFAAAAAFIGVGLYGARSGNKIGLLLIVCGGVLLIAINLI